MLFEDLSYLRRTRPLPHRHISEAARAQYFNEGFLIVRRVFSSEEVGVISKALDRLRAIAQRLVHTQQYRGTHFVLGPRLSGKDDANEVQIKRVVWAGACEPILSRYGRDPRLLHLASQLLASSELEQLINQVHFKEPGDGVTFEWHQDSRHRRYGTPLWTDISGNGSFVEAITAVDPVTSKNGGLEVIPGTCRLGHIEPLADGHTLPPSVFDPADAVCPSMEPGDVLLLHPYTIHGSGANTAKVPRRIFLNGFATPGANRRLYPGQGAGRRCISHRSLSQASAMTGPIIFP